MLQVDMIFNGYHINKYKVYVYLMYLIKQIGNCLKIYEELTEKW
jgi:hypothetical protein